MLGGEVVLENAVKKNEAPEERKRPELGRVEDAMEEEFGVIVNRVVFEQVDLWDSIREVCLVRKKPNGQSQMEENGVVHHMVDAFEDSLVVKWRDIRIKHDLPPKYQIPLENDHAYNPFSHR